MTYQFALSDIGFRLIKAYEGFSPKARLTRDGRQIIGYAQLTEDLDAQISEGDAENFLKSDLETIEDLINTHVHAALTQSQFDALCSLAYSIGPDAFLTSDVLHALNRGEVIQAANGFDGWRLGNVDGQVYVVDALVRRRTAEKALFLRPTKRTVPAPHTTLKAYQDPTETIEKLAAQSDTDRPVAKAQSNVVTLYDDVEEAQETVAEPIMELGEPVFENAVTELSNESETTEEYSSPIAEAAAEVSERLGALMEEDVEDNRQEWPESLIAQDEEEDLPFEPDPMPERPEFEVVQLAEPVIKDPEPISIHDEGRYASADKYIQPSTTTERQNIWAFVTMIVVGLTAAGAGLWGVFKDSQTVFGEFGRLAFSAAVAIGVLLTIMGLYYLMKRLFSDH